MCSGNCCCSDVVAPKSDAPEDVKKYWEHAAILNGCGKMIDGLGGYLRSQTIDGSMVELISRAISALNCVEARAENEIRKHKEVVNAKSKCSCTCGKNG